MTLKEINWDKIDKMLIAGCNGVQCAAAIGVSPDTLYLRCQQEKDTIFTVYMQDKRAHGDGLLHAAQFEKAHEEKNPTMLIWLGKQRLNQKEDVDDKTEDFLKISKKFDQIIDQFSPKSSNLNMEDNSINSDTKS